MMTRSNDQPTMRVNHERFFAAGQTPVLRRITRLRRANLEDFVVSIRFKSNNKLISMYWIEPFWWLGIMGLKSANFIG